jgi:hypothetical protein
MSLRAGPATVDVGFSLTPGSPGPGLVIAMGFPELAPAAAVGDPIGFGCEV